VTELPEHADAEAVAEHRDELVAAVRDHAGRMARELARLQGGAYGRERFRTDDGVWTLKHEAGELEFLRFEGARTDVYLVSTKRDPEPAALATALGDYPAFVAAWDAFVERHAGLLEGVPGEFPEPATAERVVAERDRIADAVRARADRVAAELHGYEGSEYSTFVARVDGTRWELKRERDRVSYLRVGGEGGAYLVSGYGQPDAEVLAEHAGGFEGFLEAFDAHVADLETELAELETPDDRG
jgi:hypothetical protein